MKNKLLQFFCIIPIVFLFIGCSQEKLPEWVIGKYERYGISNDDEMLYFIFNKNSIYLENHKGDKIQVKYKIVSTSDKSVYLSLSNDAYQLIEPCYSFLCKPDFYYLLITKNAVSDWNYNSVLSHNDSSVVYRIALSDTKKTDSIIRNRKDLIIERFGR